MKLMNHQIEGVKFLLESKFAGLSFEQGLGKSLTALQAMSVLDKPFPCLVVAPKSVVGVWKSEIKKFNFPYRVAVASGSNRRSGIAQVMRGEADILVMNYEVIRLEKDILAGIPWVGIVLDESHRAKDRKSKVAIALHELSRLPSLKYKWILSGTPMTRSPEDVWSQMYFIDPSILGSYWGFRAQHVETKRINVKGRSVEIISGGKNLPSLEAKLAGRMLRRTKEECLDLPEKIYKVIPLPMPDAIKKSYEEVRKSMALSFDKDVGQNEGDEAGEGHTIRFGSAASSMQKLHQMCQGFVYVEKDGERISHRFGDPVKLEALHDIIEEAYDESCVVFTYYKDDEDLLAKELADRKDVKLFHMTADLTAEQRSELVEAFQTFDGKGVFLGNVERCKEGITLTKANHVIYYDNSWNYGTRAQSEDRCHRVGTTKKVIYYDIVIDNSVDMRIQRVLRLKRDMADAILGDSKRLMLLMLADNFEQSMKGIENG